MTRPVVVGKWAKTPLTDRARLLIEWLGDAIADEFLRRDVPRWNAAEDPSEALQRVFLHIWEHREGAERFEDEAHARAWAWRFATRALQNIADEREKRPERWATNPWDLMELPSAPTPDAEARWKGSTAAPWQVELAAAVAKLTDRQRSAVQLMECAGFTGPVAARLEGVSTVAMYERRTKALESLRRELAHVCGEEGIDGLKRWDGGGTVERVLWVWRGLAERQRTSVWLVCVAHESVADAARLLGRTYGQVHAQMRQGLGVLAHRTGLEVGTIRDHLGGASDARSLLIAAEVLPSVLEPVLAELARPDGAQSASPVRELARQDPGLEREHAAR